MIRFLPSARIVLLIFLLTAPFAAFAQATTGSLSGIVYDEVGSPLGEARVLVTGDTLQGPRGTTTDPSGNYVIAHLPPSPNLRVLAIHGDLRSPEVKVRVKAGVVTTLNLTVGPQEETEVEVYGTPISTRQAKVVTSLPQEEARAVPFIGEFSDRSYQSLLYFNPTATHSRLAGNPAMGGATGVENVYLLDGLYTNDPVSGTFGTYMNTLFFEEMTSEIYGVEAQYGTSTGGLFNLVTRTGSNEFHGDLFAWTTHSGLMARENSDDFEITEEEAWTAVDYGFALGGPIVKDRLWFFLGVNPYLKTEERIGADLVRNLQTGTVRSVAYDYEDRTRRTSYLAKFSWRVNDIHHFDFVAYGDPSVQKLHEGPSPTLFPSARESRREAGGFNADLRWFATFSPTFFLEAHLGATRLKNDLEPQNKAAGYGTPLVVSQDWSDDLALTPGFGAFTRDDRDSLQFGLKFTHLIDTSWGFHELVWGGEWDSFDWDHFTDYSGGYLMEVSDWNGGGLLDPVSYDTRIVHTTLRPGFSVDGRYAALYIQDRWLPMEDWSVTAGLRYEWNRVEGGGGDALSLHSLSPRLGVSWDFTGCDKGKLYATAGRYYERVPLFIGRALSSGLSSAEDVYSAGQGWTRTTYATTPAQVLGGVDNQSQDEFTLGIQYEIHPDFVLGARAVYRSLNRLLETVGYVNPATGSIDLIVMNPGHQVTPLLDTWASAIPDYAPFPEPTRRYRALEITFERRFRDHWFLQGNYTWSRLEGNTAAGHDRGLSKTPEPNATEEWDIPSARWIANRFGLLPTDRMHQVKILGGYQFDFGLLLGGSVRFDTGRPHNQLYRWAKKEPGYGKLYASPRGSAGRFPSATTINFHAEYALKIRGTDLSVFVDVINVLNDQASFRIEQEVYERPNTWSGGLTVNPDWGKTTKYTDPRAVGIGVRWTF